MKCRLAKSLNPSSPQNAVPASFCFGKCNGASTPPERALLVKRSTRDLDSPNHESASIALLAYSSSEEANNGQESSRLARCSAMEKHELKCKIKKC